MTQWQPGMRITADRLNAGIDPTEITTGLVAATGWGVANFNARRVGQDVFVNVGLTNTTGGNVLVPGTNNGNVGMDPVIGTLPDGWHPTEVVSESWDNGTVSGGCVINTNGTISIRTTTYNQPVTTGSTIRITSSWTLPAA